MRIISQRYGSVPAAIGGSEEKARSYYERAVELSGGLKASTHLALATTVSVANQDLDEFRELVEEALAVDVDADPSSRLMNVLAQQRAKWLLEHLDDYFFIVEDESQ